MLHVVFTCSSNTCVTSPVTVQNNNSSYWYQMAVVNKPRHLSLTTVGGVVTVS